MGGQAGVVIARRNGNLERKKISEQIGKETFPQLTEPLQPSSSLPSITEIVT